MAPLFHRFSSLFVLLMPFLSVVLLPPTVCAGSDSAAAPFDRKNYPKIDLRLFEWPIASHSGSSAEVSFIAVDCYTQLDRSFISTDAVLRLNNSLALRHRACLLRIPTGTRLTVTEMQTTNRKSYATVLAGASHYELPLRTEYIRKGQNQNFGPWHVPCQQAYVLFNSRGRKMEWVEFRLDDETEADKETASADECLADEEEDEEEEEKGYRKKRAH
ncbi:hypothetical protein niasHS_013190 [Heterodera schachtii]|uniref:Uncharacterized protein n=2 Tax=Heterodera TaxID=34509 RepID=A0ABD2II75_HETSC